MNCFTGVSTAMGRRRFAKNSENVRHFKLVARSQADPHADDPNAPPLVLEPFVAPNEQKRNHLSKEELLQIPESLERLGPEVFGLGVPHGGEGDSDDGSGDGADSNQDFCDLDGDCYFPKDGYNYEQHLKKVSGGKKGSVGGMVLEAPQQISPEQINLQLVTNDDEEAVLRALNHVEEYEELNDDVLDELLPGGVVQEDVVLWGPTANEYEGLPDLAMFRRNIGADGDAEDDSSIKGIGNLGTLSTEADFDQFLTEEYGEGEIGACDEENIEGPASLENCEEVFNEYLKGKEIEKDKFLSIYEPKHGLHDDEPRVIEETRAIIERHYCNEGSDEEETSSGEDCQDESETWDCETVLSTLSNLSNRPGKIGRIKVVNRPGKALRPVQESTCNEEGGKECGDVDGEGEDIVELPDVITSRPRGETAEERRLRKNSVKEMRRICRKMKKESKETYKQEALKLTGIPVAVDVKPKTRCLKFT